MNQASITGESMPVVKRPGSLVYAGTVAEEGQCVVEVQKVQGGGRYDRIVRMIEESEKLKSPPEDKGRPSGGPAGTVYAGRHGADVPADPERHQNAGGADGGLLLRSEALHAHRRALRHAGVQQLSHLRQGWPLPEAVAQADTVVFDKTGTLTYAVPTVRDVVPFGGSRRSRMLRLAACLEEHYPPLHGHRRGGGGQPGPVPRGVPLSGAVHRGPRHLQHGKRRKTLIGSAHFVFEDEGCTIPAGEQEKFDALPTQYSHLYLCLAGQLAA